jgi:hypothetical protein
MFLLFGGQLQVAQACFAVSPDLDDRFSSALAVGNLDFGGRSQCAPPGYSGGSGALARQPALNLSSISVKAQSLREML